MVGDLVGDDEGDVFVRGAVLIKTATNINVTSWHGKGVEFVDPRDLDDQTFAFGSIGLETTRDAARPLDGPRFLLELRFLCNDFVNLLPMQKVLLVLQVHRRWLNAAKLARFSG